MDSSQFAEMNAIEERLLYEVRNSRHGDLFTGASAVDLVLAIRRGVANMVERGRTGPSDVAEAEGQLRRLLDEMEAARARQGLTVFQEWTVSEALGRLCPGFFPFC